MAATPPTGRGGPDPEVPAADRSTVLPDGMLRLDDWIPYQCSIVTNCVSSLLARMYSETLGIGVVEWRLLANLGSFQPLSAKELAAYTAMDAVSVTRGVAGLAGRGLVSRQTDPVDRRKAVLRLTRKGKAALEKVTPVARAIEAELVSGLSASEAEVLHGLLAKLAERARHRFGEERDWRTLGARRTAP